MPITKGTTALTIFKADNPDALKKITLDSLTINTIIPPVGADEKASGFVPAYDYYDMEWKGRSSHPAIGEYMVFALRIDTKRIAGAVLKKHYQDALDKELAQIKTDGKKFIAKDRKKEIKEQVKITLLTKTEAVPAAHEIVVNPNTGIVYLASCSSGVIAAVKEKFASCFGCELVATGDEVDFDQEKSRNFLTDVVMGRTTFAATGQITVTDSTDDTQISASSKSDSDITEIKEAINSGKKVIKTGLAIEQDGETCTMSITSTFAISGLKLPVQDNKDSANDDPDAQFLERMFLIEKYTGMVFDAFAKV